MCAALTPGRRCTVDDFMALDFAGCRTLFGNHGAFEPPIYRRALDVPTMFICCISPTPGGLILRVLRFPRVITKMKRTILTEEEIVNEYKAIKKLAPFENLLPVTVRISEGWCALPGESP